MITAADDGTARLWDVSAGKELRRFQHPGRVFSVSCSLADPDIVATAAADGTARVWSATTGTQLLAIRPKGGEAIEVSFSPDGRRLITTSEHETRLWESRTGEELIVLRHDAPEEINSAHFGPDGMRIITASNNGTAKVWEVFQSVRELVETACGRIPRQLTPEEEANYFLAPEPQSGCNNMRKKGP
jgi:WD40 repeat protein